MFLQCGWWSLPLRAQQLSWWERRIQIRCKTSVWQICPLQRPKLMGGPAKLVPTWLPQTFCSLVAGKLVSQALRIKPSDVPMHVLGVCCCHRSNRLPAAISDGRYINACSDVQIRWWYARSSVRHLCGLSLSTWLSELAMLSSRSYSKLS